MAARFDPKNHQHQRFNPLKGEWVLVSPHRLKRPWMGQEEKKTDDATEKKTDSTQKATASVNNPLCPGATRPNGEVNPDYTSTFAFQNDFPALNDQEVQVDPDEDGEDELFTLQPVTGSCRVICFHPNPNVTLPLMSVDEIVAVIKSWKEELAELGKKFVWVQIFENKGALMGCSNPHPHCQIWASSFFPNEPRVKDEKLKEYFEKHGSPLLVDYVQKELKRRERIVLENDDWVVLVPFWAFWPYETMILPKNPDRSVKIQRLTDLTEQEENSLADAMKRLTTKYDNLFQTSFPYTMGFHGAPTGSMLERDQSHWTSHAIYLPPLLRSATVKKFMVGYEMLAQAQRDITPEWSAEKLRELPEVHYLN